MKHGSKAATYHALKISHPSLEVDIEKIPCNIATDRNRDIEDLSQEVAEDF